MPNIFKRSTKTAADNYVFQPAEELIVDTPPPPPPQQQAEEAAEEPVPDIPEEPAPEPTPAEQELQYAQVQAAAILADARKEAEAYRENARNECEAELDVLREEARKAGFLAGYDDGMNQAMEEGRQQIEKLAAEQITEVAGFLEQAAKERDQLLDDTREEMKDLAVAIAEKVIRVSLKNSSDILLRMVDAATDTHKRCEWAHIYVADCDLNGKAYTAPELAAALGHISSRIRVIPMADDESGTCIVELPDVILDASVSTQLDNIKEVLDGVTLDKDDKGPGV